MQDNNSSTLIIGVGNEFRSDDRAGIVVSKKIKEKIGNKAKVIQHDGDGASLIDMWKNAGKVILVDAVSYGAVPGKIHFVDAARNQLPKEIKHHSSHLFGIADAVETSRVLKKLPPVFHIYGIEGKSFKNGTEMSREVINAVNRVVNKIINDLSK